MLIIVKHTNNQLQLFINIFFKNQSKLAFMVRVGE